MKRIILAAALAAALLAPSALAPTATLASSCYVEGYYTRAGTYVSGHYRSCPDSSTANNWSSSGNTNPYTGATGTRDPYGSSSSWSSPSYGSRWSDWP